MESVRFGTIVAIEMASPQGEAHRAVSRGPRACHDPRQTAIPMRRRRLRRRRRLFLRRGRRPSAVRRQAAKRGLGIGGEPGAGITLGEGLQQPPGLREKIVAIHGEDVGGVYDNIDNAVIDSCTRLGGCGWSIARSRSRRAGVHRQRGRQPPVVQTARLSHP